MRTAAGTVMYMVREYHVHVIAQSVQAPEILNGTAYGTPADVYSFALVVYELYAAKRPYPDAGCDWAAMLRKVACETFCFSVSNHLDLIGRQW